jgi:hypothetical protein
MSYDSQLFVVQLELNHFKLVSYDAMYCGSTTDGTFSMHVWLLLRLV